MINEDAAWNLRCRCLQTVYTELTCLNAEPESKSGDKIWWLLRANAACASAIVLDEVLGHDPGEALAAMRDIINQYEKLAMEISR